MSMCIFKPTRTEHVYRCEVCGFKTVPTNSPPERIYRECAKGDPALPNIARRTWSYAKALAKWIAAGRPERTQEQIDAILPICHGCEHFNRQHQACGLCGCPCNEKPTAVENRIAMGTEICADDPPRWT